ncbi:methyl-accepting chemotaxis protein [Ktedonospora formicarum]|uniref:Methyl-accepting chemotaxis protein n=1 Tax=Ktedonospora formicarum TaxID=2778364 RepID=A0A8J3I360_9CHLR|nr:methyl-accepting chemotaxis protein [Ktedonospora formicarum]GHO44019.1 hypothetical protein KSX_21820 [Ktedonospora formicarum]
MFRSIANIPIFRRLFYAFLLAAVVPGIIIIILGFVFTNALSGRSTELRYSAQMVQDSANVKSKIQLLSNQPSMSFPDWTDGNASTDRVNNAIDNMQQQTTDLEQTIKAFKQNYTLEASPQMKSIYNSLTTDSSETQLPQEQSQSLDNITNNLWPAYKNAQSNLIKHLQSQPNNKKQLQQDTETLNKQYTALDKGWASVDAQSTNVSALLATPGASITNTLILATIIAFLVTIMIVIVIGYIVNRTITDPLRQLANLTKRIAKGETNARANIHGRDEIYTVATSMNNMLDNIVRLIQETQSQRDVLQGQVEKLVSEVSGVGEGDLRVQAEVTADALGVLADSFNYMVEELGSLVVRVKMVAEEVEKSTTSTLDRMTQLVETGDVQIHQMGDAETEIEQLASSSRQVAERSQVLYTVANQARTDARSGRNAVQQAIEGMGRINENVQTTAMKVQTLGERSREINEIAEVISGIAHQTNRLALDAAIQAAMAGENGKGFGAVAADIRRLAERSKEQAGFINRLVRSIREDIGAVAVSMQDTQRETSGGAQLTQEASVALGSIFAAIENQAREIDGINQVATQQLESTSAAVNLMHAVSESTRQSNTSTRSASENMERLARLVEQLRASVEAFKLREGQDYIAPSSTTGVSAEELPNGTLSQLSGTFRTVTATAQPMYSNDSENRNQENAYAFRQLPGAGQFSPAPQSSDWNWNNNALPAGNRQPFPSEPQQNGNGNGYNPDYQNNFNNSNW